MKGGKAGAGSQVPRRSLTSDAGLLLVGSLFTQGAQVISLSVLARLVSKDQIATYQQLNLLYGIISPLLLAGVPAGLLFFISKAQDDQERGVWISRAYLLLGAMGLLSAVPVILLRGPLSSLLNNPGLQPALVLYAPYLFFSFIAVATPPALIASGRARGAALLNACVGGFLFVALVTTAIVRPTGEALALALSLSAMMLAAVSIVVAWRTVGINLRDSQRLRGTRQLLEYGLPLALTGLAGMIGFQFDRLVVSADFPPHEFAIYALGAVELPFGLLLAQAVSNVMVPALANRWRAHDPAGMVALWRESMCKSSLIIFPMFAFSMAMANDIVHVLYGSGYSESIVVFRIYLFLVPIRITVWGLIPQAINRTRINLVASAIVLFSNALLALSLVHVLGITGPAIAGPVSTLVITIYYVFRIGSILQTGIRRLLPLRDLALTMAIALLAALPLLALSAVALPSVLRLAIGLAVYGALTIPVLRLTGRINDTDWGRALTLMRKMSPYELG